MKETTMLIALLSGLMRGADLEYAEQPPFACHSNLNSNQDMVRVVLEPKPGLPTDPNAPRRLSTFSRICQAYLSLPAKAAV